MRHPFQLELLALFMFGAAGIALAQSQVGGGAATESPDERARRVEAEMTDDERLSMIYSLNEPAPTCRRRI